MPEQTREYVSSEGKAINPQTKTNWHPQDSAIGFTSGRWSLRDLRPGWGHLPKTDHPGILPQRPGMRAWEPQVTGESKDWTSTCSGFSTSQTKAKDGCWVSEKGAAVEGRELRSKAGKTSSNIHSRIGSFHTPLPRQWAKTGSSSQLQGERYYSRSSLRPPKTSLIVPDQCIWYEMKWFKEELNQARFKGARETGSRVLQTEKENCVTNKSLSLGSSQVAEQGQPWETTLELKHLNLTVIWALLKPLQSFFLFGAKSYWVQRGLFRKIKTQGHQLLIKLN